RNIGRFHQQSKNGRYDLAAAPTMRRMEGRTFGIVGMGATGSATAQLATALGMRVIASSRSEPPTTGVTFVERAALWAESDFVSLHLPLTNDTSRLIDSNVLSAMKPTAFLINTARGGLIDHAALTDAIIAGEIAGAALDVQDPEPPDLATPPYNDERVIVTPHAAFTSLESLLELRTRAIQQVIAILRGESAPDVVNRSDLTDS
ncbi:MAG: C-terminal binding protein, partial [bacterium]|nr:C-terminal binding protein [bacterium]